jgi:hypothetical protein
LTYIAIVNRAARSRLRAGIDSVFLGSALSLEGDIISTGAVREKVWHGFILKKNLVNQKNNDA